MPRAFLAAFLFAFAASAAGADAALAVEVAAGKSKNVRLRNLPAGTMIVRIVTSGKLVVGLVSVKQLRSPQPGALPLFRGVVERRLSFRVAIPERGDYFLVLSNRGGRELLEVQAEIRALPARAPRPAPVPKSPLDYSPRPEKASVSLWLSSI